MKKRIQSPKVLLTTLFVSTLFLISGCDTGQKKAGQIPQKKQIITGVYNGNGASPVCVLETLEALKLDPGISGQFVTLSRWIGKSM